MDFKATMQITETITLEPGEITYDFIRASGPGGQKVNKTSSAVQLRFDVGTSPSLPEEVRQRLISLAGRRLTTKQILVIEAKRFRSQDDNRRDATERLIKLIRKAVQAPVRRRKTKPSKASVERRLNRKRQRSQIKRHRRVRSETEDA
jgi:ribosome-associated protein